MPEQSQIAGVVERSRLGDQNATAIITLVRERADQGNPRAKQSLDQIIAYAKLNPPGKRPEISGVFTSSKSALGVLRDGVRRCTSREDYIAKVKDLAPRVGLTARDAERASAALSIGPEIGPEELAATQGTFESDAAKKAFQFAVQYSASPPRVLGAVQKNRDQTVKRALHIGYVMGRARRVQQVRKPDSVLAKFSPVIAYELGEGDA